MSDDDYIERLRMPQSAIDAMAKSVPTNVIQDIVRAHYPRAAPTAAAERSEAKPRDEGAPFVFNPAEPSIPPGFVRPLTGEALEHWLAESETPNVVWDYDPFANWRLR